MVILDRNTRFLKQQAGFIAETIIQVKRTAGMVCVLEEFFCVFDMIERRCRTCVVFDVREDVEFEFGSPAGFVGDSELPEKVFRSACHPADILREVRTLFVGQENIGEAGQRRTFAEQIDLTCGKIGFLNHIAAFDFGKPVTRTVESYAFVHQLVNGIVMDWQRKVMQTPGKIDGLQIDELDAVFLDKRFRAVDVRGHVCSEKQMVHNSKAAGERWAQRQIIEN